MSPLLIFTLVGSSIALNLPLDPPALSLSVRDSCSVAASSNLTSVSLGHYPPLPFRTRVNNEMHIYLRIDEGGEELFPYYEAKVIDALRFIQIQINEIGSEEDVFYGTVYYDNVSVEFLPKESGGVTRMQASNVITTTCSLVTACGPEEIYSAQILNQSDEELCEFRMGFSTNG